MITMSVVVNRHICMYQVSIEFRSSISLLFIDKAACENYFSSHLNRPVNETKQLPCFRRSYIFFTQPKRIKNNFLHDTRSSLIIVFLSCFEQHVINNK